MGRLLQREVREKIVLATAVGMSCNGACCTSAAPTALLLINCNRGQCIAHSNALPRLASHAAPPLPCSSPSASRQRMDGFSSDLPV